MKLSSKVPFGHFAILRKVEEMELVSSDQLVVQDLCLYESQLKQTNKVIWQAAREL